MTDFSKYGNGVKLPAMQGNHLIMETHSMRRKTVLGGSRLGDRFLLVASCFSNSIVAGVSEITEQP